MAELVDSILEVGLLQPVVVRRTGPETVRAGDGRAPVARDAGGRPDDDPGDHPGDRRQRHAARRVAGEPAPLAAQPAGRGLGLRRSCSTTSPARTRSWPAGSVAPVRRSATRCGCSSSARPSSGGSRPASSRPGTPGRCWPSRTRSSRTGWPNGWSPRGSASAASRRSWPSARPAVRASGSRSAPPADRARSDGAGRPALRPARDPGQGRPRSAQGQDHRRVRLARRPAPDRRHHGPTQPERQTDLVLCRHSRLIPLSL